MRMSVVANMAGKGTLSVMELSVLDTVQDGFVEINAIITGIPSPQFGNLNSQLRQPSVVSSRFNPLRRKIGRARSVKILRKIRLILRQHFSAMAPDSLS